jgi:DNA repair protein RAD7
MKLKLAQKVIAKIKASKRFKSRKEVAGSDLDNSDSENDILRDMFEDMGPLPKQSDNCEICNKRFTVTPYSRSGPDGGLLCPKCSKNLDKEESASKKKKKVDARQKRRQMQSNLLDGVYPGAKDLVTICVETLAKHVDDVEEFGDIPPHLIERLSAILSKRRLINSMTLNLFLRPDYESVTIFDGAKLNFNDYIRIFQIVPKLKHLRLRNAIQFKNVVMDHVLATTVKLESLSLHGANLVDDERWDRYLQEKGSHLRSLKVYYTDGHFGDDQLKLLSITCPDLTCLKICHNQKVTDKGLSHVANLPNLQYLSLEIYNKTTSAPYVEIINSIGPDLRTLSFATVNRLDDSVLEAIHDNCQNISKLRITDNEVMTDQGFARLFDNWYNPPLTFIDFHKCRHLDSTVPRDNPDGIGLGSLGFAALMTHSGKSVIKLNVNSCRHISLETFEKVFGIDEAYPELQELDISFCQNVNDFVVGSIFRSCPALKKLVVFGNFGVRDIRVPKGRILIGVPTALGMQIDGQEDDDGQIGG